MTGRLPRALLAAAAFAGACLWSLYLAHRHLDAQASVLDRLESSLVDLRFLAFGPRAAPKDVLIVAIDEAAVQKAGTFPLPRQTVGDIVARLVEGGAKAVVLDILFIDPGTADGNGGLAKGLASGSTAVAAMVQFAASVGQASTCQLPIEVVRRATVSGTVNIAPDASGVARHVPMLLPCGPGLLPALPLRAASLAAKTDPGFEAEAVDIGDVATPLDVDRFLALRYYGPEATIATISAADVIDGRAAPDAVRGKTVIVGATANGIGDRYPTPFDSLLPGVEILATAIGNLETGDALVRTTTVRRIDAGAAIALAIAGVAAMLIESIGIGLIGIVLLVVGWLIFVLAGFAHGTWFAMAMPLAAFVPVTALTGAGRLALDRLTERGLRRQQQTLSAFQSPAMLARLEADPDFLSVPVERVIATVFIDLSGFTGISERLGAKITRDLLRDWHVIVEEAAAETQGFVASYMADGAMLVWGMDEGETRNAARAVRASLLLQQRTLAWLKGIATITGPLGVKVGGHLGPAILSRLGHTTHQHITAIGDTVNVASRLMEVAAAEHAIMALGSELVRQAQAEGFGDDEARFSDPVDAPIRGRARPLSVRFWPAETTTAAQGQDQAVAPYSQA